MTVVDLMARTRRYASCCWWRGGVIAIVLFIVTAAFWRREDNGYMMYVAMIFMTAHVGISSALYRYDARKKIGMANAETTRGWPASVIKSGKKLTEEPTGVDSGPAHSRADSQVSRFEKILRFTKRTSSFPVAPKTP